MAGGSVFTTLGRDEFVKILKDSLTYFKFGEGGFHLSGLTEEIIDPGASGGNRVYNDYVISGGDFSVLEAIPSTKKFRIDGDYEDYFPVDAVIHVTASTGNDGKYTVVGTQLLTGDTVIEVNEIIPSAIGDGTLHVDHLPIAIGPSSDATHWPIAIEERTPGDAIVQSITDTTGIGNLTGDGTGTLNYKTGILNVEFASDVTAGNKVVVKFKYHDRRKDASLGQSLTDLEAAGSPLAPDGNPELFSYQKGFGGGIPPDAQSEIIFRGIGYGTIRCIMRLRLYEGMNDGRSSTYGGTPYYFESGIFTADDVMVAYMTFDKERHTGSNVMRHTCDFVA